jgi:hypothetical protein
MATAFTSKLNCGRVNNGETRHPAEIINISRDQVALINQCASRYNGIRGFYLYRSANSNGFVDNLFADRSFYELPNQSGKGLLVCGSKFGETENLQFRNGRVTTPLARGSLMEDPTSRGNTRGRLDEVVAIQEPAHHSRGHCARSRLSHSSRISRCHAAASICVFNAPRSGWMTLQSGLTSDCSSTVMSARPREGSFSGSRGMIRPLSISASIVRYAMRHNLALRQTFTSSHYRPSAGNPSCFGMRAGRIPSRI